MKKPLLLLILTLFACFSSAKSQINLPDNMYISVKDGHFVRNGRPYYYVGTNFWYGAILGSEGTGGNRKRLLAELDEMKRHGIDNLRILVGADGENGVATKVEPTLQVKPGIYNDTILAGLDFLLKEMGKRKMVAVLFLNNSWEWSGGYSFYLEHAGYGRQAFPDEIGYPAFMNNMAQYASATAAHTLFCNHVKFIMTRTNRYTGKKYTEDPTIMSWQIGNEPRAFSTAALPAFERWLAEAAALMRKIDNNHLISVGSEGAWGCEMSYDSYERICADRNIDYCNIHLWPYNWGWVKADSLQESFPHACANTKEYIDRHVEICNRLNKPLVMEEFGFPRDGFKFSKNVTTKGRDEYYRFIFDLIVQNARSGGKFAGCNFWGWGGFANPKHENWQRGDDYCGDPAQEAQGLNSVFVTDKSTLEVIRQEALKMTQINSTDK